MNEGRLIRKIIDIGVMLECGKLDYEGAQNDAKAVLEEIRQQCNIADFSSLFYQIDFGNHLRCKLKITDGKIEVEGAINGWGEGVPLDEVVILKLND